MVNMVTVKLSSRGFNIKGDIAKVWFAEDDVVVSGHACLLNLCLSPSSHAERCLQPKR